MNAPASRRKRPQPSRRDEERPPEEDTALLSLTPEDRNKLEMDAWEPSLLRKLLSAQDRLKRRD